MDSIISLKDISFKYLDELILDSISLEVKRGDYVGIIGPNGGGKTTLIKIMLGLLKPLSGNIRIFTKELQEFKDWSKIGYVPQRSGLFKSGIFPLTVFEVLEMAQQQGRKNKIEEILKIVGMQEHVNKVFFNLSAGQQQRILIARALINQPELLILDEPTVGIDSKAQENFYELLCHLNTQLKITLVLVSHDIDVIAKEVTTLASINQKLIYYGPPRDFIKDDYLELLYGKNRRHLLHEHGHHK